MSYIVLSKRVGEFEQGAKITEKQITDSGASVADWLHVGAIADNNEVAAQAVSHEPVTTSQAVEVGQPIEKALLIAAKAKEQNLVLNGEGTHWVSASAV